MFFPIWLTIYPQPPMPDALYPYIMLAWIIIGAIVMFTIDKKYPGKMEEAGRSIDI